MNDDTDEGSGRETQDRENKSLLDGRERAVEAVRDLGSGMIGAIPLIGSPIAGLVQATWPSLWQRRAQRLLQELERRVAHLEDERLQRDEVVTAVALAVRSAVVSDNEKIAYLAAAVANTAADPNEWQHDIVVVLMRIVAELTASHFRVLDLLVDPAAWVARTGVLLDQVERDGAYRLADDLELALERANQPVGDIALVLGDLETRGVLSSVGFGDESPSPQPKSIHPGIVSPLGHRVHRFVTWTEPDEDR